MNIDLSSFRHFCSSLPHYRWAFSLIEFLLETNHIGNEGIRMLYLHLRIFHLSSDFGFMRLDLIMEAFSLSCCWFPSMRNLELLAVSHNKITVAGLTAGSPSFLAALAALPDHRELDIDSIAFPILHAPFLSCCCAESPSSLSFTTCWINGATLLMPSILG